MTDWYKETTDFLLGLNRLERSANLQLISEEICRLAGQLSDVERASLITHEPDHVLLSHASWPGQYVLPIFLAEWLQPLIEKAGIHNHTTDMNVMYIALVFKLEHFNGVLLLESGYSPLHLEGYTVMLENLYQALVSLLQQLPKSQQLAELAQRFDAILETVPQAVVYVDDSGKSAWLNGQAAELLELKRGYNEPIQISQAMQTLRTSAENADALLQEGRELFGSGSQRRYSWQWIFGNPAQKVLSVDTVPVDTDFSHGRLWLFSDATVAYQSERHLVLMNERMAREQEKLEKANMAKTEFISRMHHELRTPLNAILGFSQLIHMDEDTNPVHKMYMQEILYASNYLLDLVNDVLDLSAIENNRISMHPESVDLMDVVDKCLGMLRPMADRRDIELIDGLTERFRIRADETRFRQVLLNLLSNAIKYNYPKGSVRVEASRINNDYLRIDVIDTGKGIDQSYMDELFEPFNRLGHGNIDVEGVGLGLTIVRHLVEMMGGRVGVESHPGRGSRFWVELPLYVTPSSTLQLS